MYCSTVVHLPDGEVLCEGGTTEGTEGVIEQPHFVGKLFLLQFSTQSWRSNLAGGGGSITLLVLYIVALLCWKVVIYGII